jgi:AraC family transcriptional regulator of adaptative response/methylated-DNA-[protein]-cysteine methyltransferase
MNTLPSTREMERAYLNSDPSYDDIFFLAVRTTGIFCRPSCRARKPKPENVSYLATAREALFAGYRPCKRCRPLLAHEKAPDWLEPVLAAVEAAPEARLPDGDLRARGLDPARVRRYFLKHYGMTFQAYCRARRLATSLQQIRRGAKLDDVALGHGYESHSGFREAFGRTFGVPPGRSDQSDCILLAWLDSPLGPLVAGASRDGICLLEFTDRRMLEAQMVKLRRCFRCPLLPGTNEHLRRLERELKNYFAGKLQQFSVPLIYPGSPFQQRVWEELRRIPYGESCSYEELACRVGSRGAQRAVGHANGLNRIAIVIPCHRVVNKDGKLGGYGGGLWRKQFLLNLEQGNVSGENALFSRYNGQKPSTTNHTNHTNARLPVTGPAVR